MTTLTTERLSDSVGAEVVGLDVDRLMTDDALPEQILAALDANGVLVFRDLHLAPEAQVAFWSTARPGGGVPRAPPGGGHLPGDPGHLEEPDGGLPAGHVRLAHRRVHPAGRRDPEMATVLTAHAVAPERRGETEFASTYG